MAKIGLSKPYFANYAFSNNTVTYSGGGLLGKYTEMSIELDGGDNNALYADNAVAESDKTFGGGSITVTTDDLDATTMATILGLQSESITTTGVTTTSATWKIWNDSQTIPHVGFGGIIKKMIGGVTKYVAFVLDNIQFANPNFSATTQGESIEWQTQELKGDIYRSEATNRPWYRMSSALDSEADAVLVIKDYLSIT